MRRKGLSIAAGFALGLLGAALPPASADWLVTREGGRIETRGSWEVKGKLVVFQAADGSLASLRLADVDVEASRKATEQARAATTPAAASARPAERKAAHRFTDKDFRKAAAPPAAAESAPQGDKEGDKKEEAAKKPGITVANWDRANDPDDGHVVITGKLRNAAAHNATNITLTVQLYDETGTQVATQSAELNASVLTPGAQSGFRAEFPGVFSFATVKFEGNSLNLVSGSDTPAPTATNR